jgi:hypothetical protein
MIIITHVHSHLGDTPLDDCNQLTVPTSAYTHMFTPFSAQDVISDVRYRWAAQQSTLRKR